MCCCGWLCCCVKDNESEYDGSSEDSKFLFKKKGIIDSEPDLTKNESVGFSIDSIPRIIEEEEAFIAIYDFIPVLEFDLEVRKGDPIKIIEEESEYSQWCNAQNKRTGKTGLIPITYITKSYSLEKESWYFSDTNCAAAETLLLWNDNENGTFLVRPSRKDPNSPYILSLRSQEEDGTAIVKHYKINYENYSYFISKALQRASLPLLIDCYLSDKGNRLKLSCGLTRPCKKSKPLLLNFGPRVKNGEIDRKEIDINDDTFVGGGHFSEVHKCKWNNIEVAVKRIRCQDNNLENLMKEIKILRSFKHKHIVNFYGSCTKKQPYLITLEYLPNGDLEKYIKKNNLIIFQKLYIISQIVSGMKYLERKNVVHRDLAARNILIGDRLMAKIADFGLSRILNTNGEYMINSNVPLPIKWTAFECYDEFKYTSKSDVWSFGILLMEIFTDGQPPYADLVKSDRDSLFLALKGGYRMPKPKDCPDEIYEKMLECWDLDPHTRPTFKDIETFFFTIFD